MGAIFDSLVGSRPVVEEKLPTAENLGEFSKGLGRGFHGLRGTLLDFAGTVTEPIAPDTARKFYSYSDAAQQDAAQYPGRVTSLKDIHNVSDFGDFAAGGAGQAVPSLLASVGMGGPVGVGLRAAGAGLGAATVGGLAAGSYPAVTGELAGSMRRDPTIMSDYTPAQRTGMALAGGVPLAAIDALPTARAVGRVLGPDIVGTGVKNAVLNTAKGALQTGVEEGVAEGAQQAGQIAMLGAMNPERKSFDLQETADATALGFFGGAPLGGAAGAAQAIKSNLPGAVNKASDYLKSRRPATTEQELTQRDMADVGEAEALAGRILEADAPGSVRRLTEEFMSMAKRTGEDAELYLREVGNRFAASDAYEKGRVAAKALREKLFPGRDRRLGMAMFGDIKYDDPPATKSFRPGVDAPYYNRYTPEEVSPRGFGVEPDVEPLLSYLRAKDFVSGVSKNLGGETKYWQDVADYLVNQAEWDSADNSLLSSMQEWIGSKFGAVLSKNETGEMIVPDEGLVKAVDGFSDKMKFTYEAMKLGGQSVPSQVAFDEVYNIVKSYESAEDMQMQQGKKETYDEESLDDIGTNEFEPNELQTEDVYIGKSEFADVPFESIGNKVKIKELQDNIRGSGGLARTIGVWDKAKRQAKDDVDLRRREDELLKKYRKEPFTDREEALQDVNSKFVYILDQRVNRPEGTVVRGEEFNNVSSKNNKWSVQAKNFPGPEHGTVWFKRKDGVEFATSVSKLITLGRKGGVTGETEGLAEQRDALLTGISSFLTAENADGSTALQPQFGFKSGESIEWGKKLPASLKLFDGKVADIEQAKVRKTKYAVGSRDEKSAKKYIDYVTKKFETKAISQNDEALLNKLKAATSTSEAFKLAMQLNIEGPARRAVDYARSLGYEEESAALEDLLATENWGKVGAALDDLSELLAKAGFNKEENEGVSDLTKITEDKHPIRSLREDLANPNKAMGERDASGEIARPAPTGELATGPKIQGVKAKREPLKGEGIPKANEARLVETSKKPAELKGEPLPTPEQSYSLLHKEDDTDSKIKQTLEKLGFTNVRPLIGTNYRKLKDVRTDKAVDAVFVYDSGGDVNYFIASRDKLIVGLRSDSITAENYTDAVKKLYAEPAKAAHDSRIETNYVHFSGIQDNLGTPLTEAEQKEIKEHIEKLLGPKINTSFVEEVLGKLSGKPVNFSADWGPGVIRIMSRLTFGSAMDAANHESMHELFNLLRNETAAKPLMDILLKAANAAPVVKQLERLLERHPAAMKQIHDKSPEFENERLAYMFQFWQAGKLVIGSETKSVFQKIRDWIRKVVGLLSEDQKAELIFRRFAEGQLGWGMAENPSEVAKVLADDIQSRGAAIKKIGEWTKPAYSALSKLAFTAQGQLEDSNNPVLQKLSRMFNVPVGESGDQGMYQARAQMSSKFLNRFENDIAGASKADLALALEYLQKEDGSIPRAEEARKVFLAVRKLLDDLHPYITQSGIERFNAETNKWETIPYRKNYFTVVYDMEKIAEDPSAFVKDLVDNHSDYIQERLKELEFDRWNDPARHEEYARAVVDRLLNSQGAVDLDETTWSLGFSPLMTAVNKRSLDWIKPEIRSKYQNKDLVGTMTSYIMQSVKRAEYVRRFGNDGDKLRDLIVDAKDAEVARMARERSGGKAIHKVSKEEWKEMEDKAAESIKKYHPAIMALEGTLGYDINPTLRELSAGMMVYQNFRILVTSLFSSLIDPLGIMVRGGTAKNAYDTFIRGVKEVGLRWKGEKSKDEATKLAEMMGTVDAGTFLEALGQTYSSLYMYGKVKRWNDWLFKINGMEAWTRATRVGATQAAIEFIQKHMTTPTDNSKRWLDELFGENQRPVLVDGKLDTTDKKVQMAVMKWVDGAILRPNAAQRPSWASDPHWALVWHMKQFTYTFHKVILERVWNEAYKHGNIEPMMLLMATYIPMMIAADAAKALLITGDEPYWMKEGLSGQISHGAVRANLMGIPQLPLEAYNKDVAQIAGPSAEWVKDWVTEPAGEQALGSLPFGNVVRQWGSVRGL